MVFMAKMRRRWNMLKSPGFLQFLIALIPLFVCTLGVYSYKASEPSIRICGLLLQVAGMGLVIFGLNKTLQEFGEKTIGYSFWRWLVIFFKGEPRFIHGEAHFVLTSKVGLQGDFKLLPISKDATTEERLKRLEGGIDALISQVRSDRRSIYVEIDKMRKDFKNEVAGREKDLSALSTKVHRVHAGGAGLTLMGTFWLFVGVVIGTFSGEISKVF